jgi:hypothetical protein
MRLSGAKTKKDTVNLALREFAARHRRVAALSPSERRCGSRLCTERLISDLPGSRYALGHGH